MIPHVNVSEEAHLLQRLIYEYHGIFSRKKAC